MGNATVPWEHCLGGMFDPGDSAFMLTASVFVLLMMPAYVDKRKPRNARAAPRHSH